MAQPSVDDKINALADAVGGLMKRVERRADAAERKDEGEGGATDLDQIKQMLSELLAHVKGGAAEAEDDGEVGTGQPEEVAADNVAGTIPPGRETRADAMARERDQADQLAALQTRWTQCAHWWGKDAARPMMGDTPASYDRREATRFKQFSKTHKHTDLSKAGVPDNVLRHISDVIAAEAAAEARNPDSVPRGRLRQVTRYDQAGRPIHEFVGDLGWMDQFRGPKLRARINRPHGNVYNE